MKTNNLKDSLVMKLSNAFDLWQGLKGESKIPTFNFEGERPYTGQWFILVVTVYKFPRWEEHSE